MIDSTTNKIIIPKEFKKILMNINKISKEKYISIYTLYICLKKIDLHIIW